MISENIVRYRGRSVVSAKSWMDMKMNDTEYVLLSLSMIKLNENLCERNEIVKVKLCVQTEVEK